jgi:hypothetical protein
MYLNHIAKNITTGWESPTPGFQRLWKLSASCFSLRFFPLLGRPMRDGDQRSRQVELDPIRSMVNIYRLKESPARQEGPDDTQKNQSSRYTFLV